MCIQYGFVRSVQTVICIICCIVTWHINDIFRRTKFTFLSFFRVIIIVHSPERFITAINLFKTSQNYDPTGTN